jgi:two-component system, chemotaxis family, sensor histidine kinase and response regulator WspE
MSAENADPMLLLFQQDTNAAAGVLLEALAVLAVDLNHATPLEPLERAVRQIKACSLIVGQTEAVTLARAIEVSFSALRAGAPFSNRLVSDLVEACHLLKNLAAISLSETPNERPTELIEQVANRLCQSGDPVPTIVSVKPPEPAPVPVPPPPPIITPTKGEAKPQAAPPSKNSQVQALMELFREETRSLCETLSSGLVELESSAGDPRKIEPLMRAAHSIKGAARIVDCEPAVDVAHVMEELLVMAQKGKRLLNANDIDLLLKGVDLLGELVTADLVTWAATNQQRAHQIAAAIQSNIDGVPAKAAEAKSVPPEPAPAPTPVPVLQAASPALPPPVTPPTAAQSQESADQKERVVRVSAQSLTRLLSLAGESLVEARWLQPFARSMLKLKKYQDYLADVLEELQRQENLMGTERGQRLTEEARQQLSGCRQVLAERIDEFEIHARRSDDLNSRLYREVIASRMRPFADGTHGLSRMVRDVARQLGKNIQFEVIGQDTDVDRDILDKLEAPLGHLLRNAVDHGMETPEERRAASKPETGRIRLEARHHAGVLNITIQDDGRGIDKDRLKQKIVDRKLINADLASKLSDPELYDFLFLPGFSTADKVTAVSGRGVGLDVVQAMAQAVGGTIRVTSKLGKGTTFELNLPITLSVLRAVLVRISGDPYALPLNRSDRLLKLPASSINTLEGKPHIEVDGRNIGVVPAHLVLELPPGQQNNEEHSIVLFGDRSQQYGLLVEGFLGEQDLVVRPLDPRLGKVPNISAAALLEDGSPVLIIDVDDVIRSAANLVQEGRLRHHRHIKTEAPKRRKRVLVVDDSAIVREVERQMLLSRGYDVDIAVDGVDGWNALRGGGYDLIVSDIDMPRMTGLELIRAIRSEPKVQSTPVIIVSYKDREEDRVRGLDAGANYYLTKSSFHDGRFLGSVEELIGGPDE